MYSRENTFWWTLGYLFTVVGLHIMFTSQELREIWGLLNQSLDALEDNIDATGVEQSEESEGLENP